MTQITLQESTRSAMRAWRVDGSHTEGPQGAVEPHPRDFLVRLETCMATVRTASRAPGVRREALATGIATQETRCQRRRAVRRM